MRGATRGRVRRCSGLYVGVPVQIGAGGVEKVLEIELTADEKKALDGVGVARAASWSRRPTRSSPGLSADEHPRVPGKELLRALRRRGAARAGLRHASTRRVAAARELGGPCVVKAQIHAGGRGKAGGVKLVKDVGRRRGRRRSELLGKTLVTHQTGPQGRVVRRLLVEAGLRDRARALPRHGGRSRDRAGRR